MFASNFQDSLNQEVFTPRNYFGLIQVKKLSKNRRTIKYGGEVLVMEEENGEQSSGQTENDAGLAALTHILALFTWILGPLLVYVFTDDEFVKENAANALNWQISFSIYMVISAVLMVVLIGFLFVVILGLLDLIFCIVAAVKASEGEAWDYPITINLL